MTPVRPCRRCGASRHYNATYPQLGGDCLYMVECLGCGQQGPKRETRDEAREAWNEFAEGGEGE